MFFYIIVKYLQGLHKLGMNWPFFLFSTHYLRPSLHLSKPHFRSRPQSSLRSPINGRGILSFSLILKASSIFCVHPQPFPKLSLLKVTGPSNACSIGRLVPTPEQMRSCLLFHCAYDEPSKPPSNPGRQTSAHCPAAAYSL